MKQYVVDAFTNKVFSGNPAAICIMDKWISDDLMLSIAKENNLSETAFAVKLEEDLSNSTDNESAADSNTVKYKLRWFTSGGEIDLCGHATLATAYTIMNYYEKGVSKVIFNTLSGDLIVEKKIKLFDNEFDNETVKKELYELDFPMYDLKKVEVTDKMVEVIGVKPLEAYMGRDLLCVLENVEDVIKVKMNMEKVKELDGLLLHLTAREKENEQYKSFEFDCVSRSFAPKLNVVEDPVCGSGHCHIVPYWSKKLGKEKIVAYQASERSGVLYCEVDYKSNRIKMAGEAALYSIAEIFV